MTFAYHYIPSFYESSENTTEDPVANLDLFPNLNWHSLSSLAAIRLLPVLTLLAVVSVSGQAFAIQKGANGAEVVNVQRCLQRLGYYNGPVNGNFGSLTENAVIKFQKANRLATVGIVGPQTQRLLQSKCQTIGNTNGDLRLGSRGPAVSALQRNLQQLNFFNGPITGNFGRETQQAVIRFQQFYGIRADGVVGVATRDTIRISLNPVERPDGIGGENDSLPNALNFGDRGVEVTRVQQALQQLRYFNTNPTGYFGSTTRDAVVRFQQDYGLEPNGIADEQTLGAISNALRGQNPGCSTATGDICQGERSQRVVTVQQRLQDWGFFNGNINGYFDPATRDAVAQFQQESGIIPTGFVNFETWQALRLGNQGNPNAENPNSNRYVVVVPMRKNDILSRVRQYVPEAFSAESGRGAYVNAGQFRDRSDAEQVSKLLRSRGLDARVEYF